MEVFTRNIGSIGAWPLGRGSRGWTALHYAALNGRDLVVQRLLEAKAAVDAKTDNGRGQTRIWGGNPLEGWGCCEELDEMFNVDSIHGSSFWWISLSLFVEKVPKQFASTFFHVLYFVIWTVSLGSPRSAFRNRCLWSDLANMASIEYKIRQQWFLTNSTLQDISKPQRCLSPGRSLGGHNFQNFDSWGAKIFSEFSPLGSTLGPQLPRQHTAAFRSRVPPRRGRPAASRGRGSDGCAEQHGPWPRTRIWGGNPPEAMGLL